MRALGDAEYNQVWKVFHDVFAFRPSVKGPFPGISEPADSITFRLLESYSDSMIDELAKAIFSSFEECGYAAQEIYYLDWQHECYAIQVQDALTAWATGFPDGDYAIMVSKDMKVGTFGHPWEYSICIFGDQFIKAFLSRKPAILQQVIRNSGGYNGA